jgi:hypothetical protein
MKGLYYWCDGGFAEVCSDSTYLSPSLIIAIGDHQRPPFAASMEKLLITILKLECGGTVVAYVIRGYSMYAHICTWLYPLV